MCVIQDQQRTFVRSGLIALAYACCFGVYLLRLDPAVGLFVDDGWYVLLAKALADGQGFTVINSPSPGIMPLYPPGFPAVLSLIFRIAPAFPENVWLLKSVSVASVFLAAALVYKYLVREQGMNRAAAHGIALLTLLTPAIVFFATSTVMSECFFTFLQLGAIVCVERCLKAEGRGRALTLLVGGACFASLAFLTRPIAVGLICAAGVYLLLNRRIFQALIFSLVVFLILGPWLAYSKAHEPTAAQKHEQQGLITQSYVVSFWQKAAGDPGSGVATFEELPARVLDNIKEMFVRDAGGIALPALYRPADESGEEALGMRGDMGIATDAMIISSALGALCALGFALTLRRKILLSELALVFTLPVILTWPWAPIRFLVPFTPFILLYLLRGVDALWPLIRRLLRRDDGEALTLGNFSAAARVFLLCAVLLNVYDHVNYILRKFDVVGSRPEWLQSFDETEELLSWMRVNIPPDSVVATENPPLVHLRTGLKTVWSAADPLKNPEDFARRNVAYLAHVSAYHSTNVSRTDAPSLKILRYTERRFLYVLEP